MGIARGALFGVSMMLIVSSVRADPLDAEAAEARAHVRVAMGQMDGTAQRLRVLLREARAKQMTNKLGCLDEALSRADVSVRRAKEHARSAMDAFARRDVDQARRELHEVSAMRESSREASTLADNCAAGKLDFPAPETTVVRVYVDPQRTQEGGRFSK
jgi:molybdopterin biosynthesis enzyme